ncbi:NTP pyrophosphatase (non-canonical NTP hydrolase) [Alkalibacillus filiformis]|uniref:NTP pyrophosphatase (Non-canonical NTP hydrolase) n=1 Tax=Alkalibacillus filiformis TaxID=200990 RepID=A0ABU0DV38_9BACI|nr:MazG-like family protein [Alkalibacillus filiformis]MDQ0352319.1 NTP pyrophosphatase (non-canonical NTP hydrolase) [Alkalibacillus filiformis]
MEQLLTEIKSLSEREPKTLEQMALKLTEEVGETSQAVLSYLKASGSDYKQLGIDDVKEECIDVVLVALAMYYKLSENEEEFGKLVSEKLNKWESKISYK